MKPKIRADPHFGFGFFLQLWTIDCQSSCRITDALEPDSP